MRAGGTIYQLGRLGPPASLSSGVRPLRTPMKTIIFLILSCAQVFAADTGVRVVSSAITNVESASITTTEVFTRDGQTNLVRQTQTKAGAVQGRVHWFYRDGSRLATYVVTPKTAAFVPEAGSRYSVS